MPLTACRLAADDDDYYYGARPPLVLLHGLTFGHSLSDHRSPSCAALTPAGGSSRWTFPATAHPRRDRPATSKA